MKLPETAKKFTRLNIFLASQETIPLTKHDSYWLACADKLANSSLHPKNRVGSIIYQRGKFISQGINETKTHPYQAKWNRYSGCLHAEISAIIEGLRTNANTDWSSCSIAVSRIKRNDTLCSYPCQHCYPAIEKLGIRHIVCYDCDSNAVSIRI